MDMECNVPPGFRFHPTEEELVGYYLKRKIDSLKFDLDVITDIDLYKIEPWDIQEKCKLGYEEQNEWYFFSHKDRKYPTGTRTNRATAAGFWKATGRDKAVVCKNKIIGMRKTLVFYKGRAPNGAKSDWIMHEYRLQTSENSPSQEEGWVVCRAFKKPIPNQRHPPFDPWNNHPNYYPNYSTNHFRPPNFSHSHNPNLITSSNFHQPLFAYEQPGTNQLIDLPKLESPTNLSTSFSTPNKTITNGDYDEEITTSKTHLIDWKILDNLLGSNHVNDSFSNPNFPSIPQTYDLDTYDTHCFPGSQQRQKVLDQYICDIPFDIS